MNKKNVLVIPYYEDKASMQFCQELAKNFGNNITVIVVDDGSIKRPFKTQDLTKNNLSGHVIRLQRNVGHQTAITIGLNYACENLEFDQLVIMDSDGEDKPGDIQSLLDKLNSEDADIVVAKRTSRQETKKFKAFYCVYKLLFRILVGKKIAFGNFMAMSKIAAKRLSTMPETRIHLAASTLKSKLHVTDVPIARGKRYQGQSLMNTISLTLHGISSITVFAENVLARITLFCALSAASILFILVVMVILKLSGLTVIGWFSTISGILLLMLFQVGIMALLVLLLSGNVRAASSGQINYQEFIKDVINVA